MLTQDEKMDDLVIDGHRFQSRLFVGTGKYRSVDEMVLALEASGSELVTLAVTRLNLNKPKEPNLMSAIDWSKYKALPNTAGCKTAEQSILTANLARELFQTNWIKLEVINDERYLLPDPIGTLQAAKELVKDGFTVLPYINADPVLARQLEDIGCATVMPLASPIGSGQGVVNSDAINIIAEQASIPVVVDAGLGVPSDASKVMEMGIDAVLVNTAIAQAGDPQLMARAFHNGVIAGRQAFLAQRIPVTKNGSPSSPVEPAVN